MLTEGMYVADRYEIVGKIGTGGMSDVYKAKDHILGRFVAIKVLKQEFSEDVNFVTKFHTEAQSAAGLEHPNIVNIYDVGSENGIYFIVMECIEGITLKTYIEKKGQLTYKEAVSIAIQVGRGIEAAHNKHIIHRDIKPQNIIISTEGKVKVTDFGIARAATSNTINSDVMGSVHYTSPEQARNGFVDGKSDIYSLGIVMFEMVTGRVPFDGDSTVAVAIQHLQEEMPSPGAYAMNLPISMEKIIMKCTQKNPDRRYESIGDLLVDLKKVLISPDEDFVTIAPIVQDKTRVIQEQDVEIIKKETNHVYYKEEPELEGEDEDEDGGFLNPKMEKAFTIMGIVAAVIIVAIVILIILSFKGVLKPGGGDKDGNDTQIEENLDEDTVIMISLEGMTEEEAREALKELNLGLKVVGTTASDEFEEGQIVTQNIKEGDKIKKNETIEVTICSGPGEFEAPSVVGKDADEAQEIIEAAGLVAKRDYAYDETVPEGKVIKQTPEAGTSVKEGDTITYIVSRGAETVKVPDVTGMPEAEARATLEAAGFVIGNVTKENHATIPEGNVISQTPEGNEYEEKGTTVDLVISQGKKTVYYSYSATIAKPSADAKVISVELFKAESDESITIRVEDNGDSITITATNITNCDSGTLVIKWATVSIDEATGEEILTELPLDERNVSFQKQ